MSDARLPQIDECLLERDTDTHDESECGLDSVNLGGAGAHRVGTAPRTQCHADLDFEGQASAMPACRTSQGTRGPVSSVKGSRGEREPLVRSELVLACNEAPAKCVVLVCVWSCLL